MSEQPYPPSPGQPWGPPLAPVPPKKSGKKWPWIVGGVVAVLVVAGIASGGDKDESDSAAAGPTSTAPAARPTSAAARPTTTQPAVAPLQSPAAAPPAVSPAPVAPAAPVAPPAAAAAAPVAAMMPDVVCMNLQAAQDRIQEAGVFFSRSADATGAGRRQVVDSNWIVVGQTPPAGAPVGELEAVLSAVKIGEPSPC